MSNSDELRDSAERGEQREEYAIDDLQWGTMRDWGQLVRLPNVFTLFSDCMAAAVVATGTFWPLTAFVPTVVASLCAYWAGMILNDVVDLEDDRKERPSRPLASGKISPVVAGHIAKGMLLIGPILILAVNTFHTSSQLWLLSSFAAAVVLSVTALAYNSVLKKTPLGPILMGLCRSLNILMVGSTLLAVNSDVDAAADMPYALWALSAGIGIYILGVTVYASQEERESASPVLVAGMFFEVFGLLIIAAIPWWLTEKGAEAVAWTLDPLRGYPLLIGLIGLTVVNRSFSGVMHPVSRKVQLAVRHAILTLILVDASVVLMWGGTWFALAVVLLLLPALVSAMRFRST